MVNNYSLLIIMIVDLMNFNAILVLMYGQLNHHLQMSLIQQITLIMSEDTLKKVVVDYLEGLSLELLLPVLLFLLLLLSLLFLQKKESFLEVKLYLLIQIIIRLLLISGITRSINLNKNLNLIINY